MCTVTFIPLHNKILFTHSRDESSIRAKAIAPKEYSVQNYDLLFPKDAGAGGTWIACGKNGNAAALMNGAFEKHEHKPPYKKSRGLIFMDMMASDDLYFSYVDADLTGIEPFTVILWNNKNLYECRWNGGEKNITRLEETEAYTWSSVTLYDEAVLLKRKEWFQDWLQQHPGPCTDEIIEYHLTAGDGDVYNNIRMNRDGKMLTVSITAMETGENKTIMTYLDLLDNTTGTSEIIFTKAAAIQ
ncbi:MAG: NRDE family protein [Bacteroidota bacterium]